MSGANATHRVEKVRYHGLDALRAWAMSMGVVLHAAWIMTPGDSGAPKTDASASFLMDYLAGGIHMFRMQLFFLLAGFFACLLVRKRGPWKFSINRTMRIGIPLVLFWLILRPPMTAQFYEAKNQSGEFLTGETAWSMVGSDYANMTAETVFTMHLWFIYYLFLTYILFLVARLLVRVLDRESRLRDWVSSVFGYVFCQPWSVVPLAVLTGLFMLPMGDFGGIQIDPFSLYPLWAGLLSYVAFFSVGWFLFRNVDRLGDILRGWKWQLAVGVALTVVYYFFSHSITQSGYQTPRYPALTVSDLHFDSVTEEPVYPQLREQLLNAAAGSVTELAWSMLPAPNRRFVEDHPVASQNQISGLLGAINTSVLANSEFAEQAEALDSDVVSVALGSGANVHSKSAGSVPQAEQVQLSNRKILEAELEGIIWGEDVNRPYYFPIRLAFSLLYSIGTWLLIFGCLGFSQHYFDYHSRFWRYFSDASYWVYLMHLLVQFQMLLWFGDQAWHWSFKFSLYVLGTLAVLVPTYHFLVRPTWLGWLLNGRMFPIWSEPNSQENRKATLLPANEKIDRPAPQLP